MPVLVGGQRLRYFVGIFLWATAVGFFWVWWLQPAHMSSPALFAILTAAMAWTTLFPAYFIAHYSRATKPAKTAVPEGLSVAMVVTKAPSEPFEVVAKTLRAMLAQAYPHDTWLADENPSPETFAWCAEHGVQVSTRFGIADYHRKSWPRRTRCKEGNLAYFYDQYGYEMYDFVVQLDADHVPERGYLEEMLRPFTDARVGYVSAPSICDSNAETSWVSRARLYAEGNLHGALQAGYTSTGGSICFGSHYAVRTKALQQIGGLGPELAEDHSTSMMMVAHGWRGAHAIDAIAHGDGPKTFADLVTQEFQWARSVVTILLRYSPRYLPKVPLRVRSHFLFSQLWYPLFSFFALLGFLLPIAGIAFKVTYASVSFPMFVLHAAPIMLVLVAISYQWRRHGTLRPVDAKILSWEVVVYQFARWPWTLLGCLAAVRERLTNTPVDFRVTPKGSTEADPLPLRLLMPYAVLSVASAVPCLLVADAESASGMYMFAFANACTYAVILLLVISRHASENRVRAAGVGLKTAVAVAVAIAFVAPAATLGMRGLDGIHSLSEGAPFSLTRASYSPSGAGHGALRKIQFKPSWTL